MCRHYYYDLKSSVSSSDVDVMFSVCHTLLECEGIIKNYENLLCFSHMFQI